MRKTNPNQKKSHPPGKLPVLRNPTSQNHPRQLSCLSASLQLQSQDIRARLDLLEKIPRLCGELKSCLNTLSPPHLQSSSQCSPVGFPVGYVSLGGLGHSAALPKVAISPHHGEEVQLPSLGQCFSQLSPKSFNRIN